MKPLDFTIIIILINVGLRLLQITPKSLEDTNFTVMGVCVLSIAAIIMYRTIQIPKKNDFDHGNGEDPDHGANSPDGKTPPRGTQGVQTVKSAEI